ncbi:MAG: phenylalanine--tRNA ligase subunit alpha, partial [Chloroflexota bacterium]
MLEKIEQIKKTALLALAEIKEEAGLNQWKVTHLGRSSAIMDVFKNMGSFSKEERGQVGRTANQVKQALQAALEEKAEMLHQAE